MRGRTLQEAEHAHPPRREPAGGRCVAGRAGGRCRARQGGTDRGRRATVGAAGADTHADNSAPNQAEAVHWKTLFALAAFSLLFYFWFLDAPVEPDVIAGALENNAATGLSPSESGESTTPHQAEHFFTVGSKPGEVYAAQGIPSKTEPGIWHYGKSRVYFVNGGVSRWDNHPDNPLNASLDVAPDNHVKDFIRRGSTKDEVRALQGTPWAQTEREWTYGSSRIFFSGDVVTGWQESAMNPLKIQR